MPQIAYINGFAGGINQSLTPEEIADSELVDSMNFELDTSRAIAKRNGVSRVKSSTSAFAAKLKSIYHYKVSNGNETVLYVEDNATNDKAYKRSILAPGSATGFTAIDASVALPPNASFWQWATMDDAAIAVNGTDGTGSYDNPVIITQVAGSLVDTTTDGWTGTWPDSPTLVAVWNRRLWLVEDNVLYGSALGDRTDWLSTGGSGRFQETVGEDEGDVITAIFPFFDRLIIFKRNRIYQLVAGSPNVDGNQYEIRPLTHKLGCVDPATVQYFLGDILFLSDHGVASLRSTEQYGDFQQAIVSRNIPSLATVNKNGTRFASVIHNEASQYWLSVPSSSTANAENDLVWVLDLKRPDEGLPWMKFDGGVAANCYGVVPYLGRPHVYIGGYENAYIYDEDAVDDDLTDTTYAPSPTLMLSKAFSLEEPLRRKEWYRWGVEFDALVDPLDWNVKLIFDASDNRVKLYSGQLTDTLRSGSKLANPGVNAELWNDALSSGSFILEFDVESDTDVIRSIRGWQGRRAQTLQFQVQNEDAAQDFRVKRIMMQYQLLEGFFGVTDG